MAGVLTGVVAVGAGLLLHFAKIKLSFSYSLRIQHTWRGCFHRVRRHNWPPPRPHSRQRPAWSACSASQTLRDPFPLQSISPGMEEGFISKSEYYETDPLNSPIVPSQRLVQLHPIPVSHVIHKVNLGLSKLKRNGFLARERNPPIQGSEQCHGSHDPDQVCLSPKPDPQLEPGTRKDLLHISSL